MIVYSKSSPDFAHNSLLQPSFIVYTDCRRNVRHVSFVCGESQTGMYDRRSGRPGVTPLGRNAPKPANRL
jgi:hypothetical protein